MQGRKRTSAVALGTLAVVPLAAEAADARPVDDSGAPSPTTTTPDRTPAPTPQPPTPAVPRDPKPANPTIDTDAPPPVRRSYGDEHRQPVPVREQPKPEPGPANPTIDTGAPPPVRRSHGDEHGQPVPVREQPKPEPKPANPTIDTDARPPVRRSHGDEHRQPVLVREQPKPGPKPANPTIDTGAPPPPVRQSYRDEHRQPMPVLERVKPEPSSPPVGERVPVAVRDTSGHPTNPTIEVDTPPIGNQARPPGMPQSADGAERWLKARQGETVDYTPPAEPEEEVDTEKLIEGAAKTLSDDGGSITVGVDVDLPGDRFDFGVTNEVDPEAVRETMADTVGPLTATTMNPLGGLLNLRDHVRKQLPEEVRPFTLSGTELLALGGQKLADQIPAGPSEPTLDDGPGALVEGYMRNNLRDGILTLSGLPQGVVDMPKNLHTDMSNGSEDLFRHTSGADPREGSERLPGETGLEHYTRNYPFTGGFGNMGVNLYDRWSPFVAARYGNYGPLREDMTDPDTGEMRAPTLVRDYYRAPNSTLLEDLAIPSLFVPFVKVPVRAPVKPPTVAPVKPPTVKPPRVKPPTVEPPVIGPRVPRTPSDRVRERVPKLDESAGTGTVLDELTGNTSSGTRANTPRPERTDPDTGTTTPRQFEPSRTGGSTSELYAYTTMQHVPEVGSIRLVEHASGTRTPDAVLTLRRPDGSSYTSRFEMTSVVGRGSGYQPVGPGRNPQATARQVRAAIDRKTQARNQFEEPMAGVAPGGIQGIHLRGKPLSVSELQAIVQSRTARLQSRSVTEVWFFLSDRTLVRFDVNKGTNTVVKPPN